MQKVFEKPVIIGYWYNGLCCFEEVVVGYMSLVSSKFSYGSRTRRLGTFQCQMAYQPWAYSWISIWPLCWLSCLLSTVPRQCLQIFCRHIGWNCGAFLGCSPWHVTICIQIIVYWEALLWRPSISLICQHLWPWRSVLEGSHLGFCFLDTCFRGRHIAA